MKTGQFFAALALPAALLAGAPAAHAAEGEGIGGFYVGIHGGRGSDSSDWAGTPNGNPAPGFSTANVADIDASGWLLGGTVGGRWQTGYLVLGLEGEASWANLEDSAANTAFAGRTNTTEIDWIGTVTAQFGIQTGKVHGYLEAGLGFTGSDYSVADADGVAPDLTGGISDTRSGPVFGAGFEYLVSSGFSLRGEYNYMNFGSNDYTFGGDTWEIDQTLHVFRLAALYRF
ncbi:outer membrane beta-barrel protein [Sphingosinicella sp. LHD-64]|uniref:outer membrane protein n=1 Tax=Sphingosinicella sp. LHD-64 TaxID=3072139 RepID=UPI0028105474|nr:outer membrane beta-barrel protein [Sphingosinicella sp. LHD-64]MDQ8758155.1 outer membrane beta-barrel protein [Sphingosinicella sp. LHD-64]